MIRDWHQPRTFPALLSTGTVMQGMLLDFFVFGLSFLVLESPRGQASSRFHFFPDFSDLYFSGRPKRRGSHRCKRENSLPDQIGRSVWSCLVGRLPLEPRKSPQRKFWTNSVSHDIPVSPLRHTREGINKKATLVEPAIIVMASGDSELTMNSVLGSTLHDRQRREERSIAKITLQEARRYGMSQQQAKGRIRYDYAGHVFIYDPRKNRAITSYKKDPNYVSASRQGSENTNLPNGQQRRRKKQKEPKSGTMFQRPVMIQKSVDHITDTACSFHTTIHEQVRACPDKWSSNTVFVVDMSGSMREDDVNGARCRSDGVWTTLAKDFVQKQLEAETCSVYDVVSVVLMREEAEVVIECEPIDWVLYNKLVSFREVSEQLSLLSS